MPAPETPLGRLILNHAQPGQLMWIGLRPARRAEPQAVEAADVTPAGLAGDHRDRPGKRAVTLIQWEHLPVIAALTARTEVAPTLLRRNLAVAGINLLGLRSRRFRIGDAVLEGSGLCAPCSRMEDALGHGGYAAVRGHGGICAQVLQGGAIRLGDRVAPLD